VVAFLWGLSRGSVFTVREAIQAGKPAAVVLAGGGAVLPVFVGGAWVPCSIGPVAAFRWVARPGEARPARRGWLARVFQVPDGEPTHALLSHISALGPGERLWFERGVLAGDSVLVAHEALSDTPAFLATPRLMRRFRCSPREAAGLAELFLALDAGAAVVAHYAVEAGRRGAAAVIEDLAHLVARLALSEQVPDTDALVIRQLVAEMVTAGRSRDLIRNVVAPIRGTFNEAIEAGLRLPNPAARIGRFLRDRGDLRRRTDPLTGEEEALVLAAAREHYPRHFPMLLCALRTGMRLGELLGLQWGDIDFQGRFIEVRRSLVEGGRIELPKNGKIRRVDISLVLAETLQRLRVQRAQEALARGWKQLPDWVFCNEEGRPIWKSNFVAATRSR
jgi:integrase